MNNKNITKRRGRMHRRNIPVGGAIGNNIPVREEGEQEGEADGPAGEQEGEQADNLPDMPLSLAVDSNDRNVNIYIQRRMNARTPIWYRSFHDMSNSNIQRARIAALRNAFSNPRYQPSPPQEGEQGGRRTRRTHRKKHASRRKHKSYCKRK
jgi:hypothetical protein